LTPGRIEVEPATAGEIPDAAAKVNPETSVVEMIPPVVAARTRT
jgi:hypothetical protein